MADNYADLQQEVALWLDRDDMAELAPKFITFGERRISRVLRVPEMETTTALSVINGSADLPTDFLQARSVYSGTAPSSVIEVLGFSQFKGIYPVFRGGQARHCSVSGGQMIFGPGGDFTATINYYASIPPLSAITPSNWLLESDPDVYLAAALVEGYTYTRDPEGMSIWSSRLSSGLADVAERGRKKMFGSAPLVMRVAAPTFYTNETGGTPTPTPTLDPVFSVLPSISPTSGIVGDLFTASDGSASDTTDYTRRWLLDGAPIGTGTTVTPDDAGSLVLEVTATGPGGTTVAYSTAVEVGPSPALDGMLDFSTDTQSGLLALLEDI